MLPVILAAATILGGVAALVFFWDLIASRGPGAASAEGLAAIEREIRAVRSPLLPCRLFLTLRFSATDEDVEKLFGGQAGYQAFGRDRPMPPPPLGLPPGVTEGRLFWKELFLDFENGKLTAAGIHSRHPGYNVARISASETVASMSDEVATQLDHPVLVRPPQVRIELRFTDSSSTVTFSARQEAQQTVQSAYAFDNEVFVDHSIPLVPETRSDVEAHSYSDLAGAELSVNLGFLFIHNLNWLDEGNRPSIHNLQLMFGSPPDKAVGFSLTELESHVMEDNPDLPVAGQAISLRLQFKCRLGDVA